MASTGTASGSEDAAVSSIQSQYYALFTDPAYRRIVEELATTRRSRGGVPASASLHDDAPPPAKPSFIDVPSTGMRLAYYDYGAISSKNKNCSSGGKVILLLHDVGTSAAVWHGVASALAETGAYHVISLDLRGHGRSTWGCGGSSYAVEMLAKDVYGFIVEKGLYARPVCVFGIGMGGLVGIVLAGMGGKKLIGAVGMVEGGVLIGGDGVRGEEQPWVGKSLVAGLSAMGGSTEMDLKCTITVGGLAGWLASPLSGVGPRVVREAVQIVEAEGRDREADTQQQSTSHVDELDTLVEYATGDERRCLELARALLREDQAGTSVLRADPAFALQFSADQLKRTLERLDMHVLFMFGEHSLVWSRQDVCALSSLCTGAESVTVEELPEQSSRFVRDDPEGTTDVLLEYVVYSATGCFEVGSDVRTPEDLGLRPLDQFESLEAAQKALGPRKVPTRATIEEALRELRVAEGRDADDVSSDEEEGADGLGSGSATALCQDNRNYFGFVG